MGSDVVEKLVYTDGRTKIKNTLKKITMVVTTNSHCKSVIISGTIFYSWD